MALTDFLKTEEQQRIVDAIAEAEHCTSGEICVHITPRCWGSPYKKALRKFYKLGLFKTERRNAVLIFVAYKSRKFAIIGDEGINNCIPEGFWDKALQQLGDKLKTGEPYQGLCQAIHLIGEQLSAFFPADKEENNELSNEIIYED